MDLPWSFGPQSVAAFILFIGVLVFVHELGHFLAAKFFRIRVTKFSLGFGPPLLSFQYGDTLYQIAAVPLGGFVKMAGDTPGEALEAGEAEHAFTSAPVYQRAVVAVAGPAFNLIFPVLCFFAYNISGPEVLSPVVGQVEPGRPGAQAGLQPGDRVLSVEGERAFSFGRLSELISARPNQATALTIQRGGAEIERTVTPAASPSKTLFGQPTERGLISVSWNQAGTRVGVAFPDKDLGGFRTGDRILSVDGEQVGLIAELLPAFQRAAGRRAKVIVDRPQPVQAGGLLYASAPKPTVLSVPVPEGLASLDGLGIAPSGAFVRSVVPGGPAARGGLKPGDQLLSANGHPVGLFWSFVLELEDRARGAPVPVKVRRGGQERTLSITAETVSCIHPVTKKSQPAYDSGLGAGLLPPGPLKCDALGRRANTLTHWGSVAAPAIERAQLSVWEAFTGSLRETAQVVGLVAQGIFKLISGEVSTDNLGGPLSLFKVAAQAAEVGWGAYLRMMALISVNLGLINLLPVPIFDGGNLALCGVEAIRRRPLSAEARERIGLVGLLVVVALFVLAFSNDLRSLGLF